MDVSFKRPFLRHLFNKIFWKVSISVMYIGLHWFLLLNISKITIIKEFRALCILSWIFRHPSSTHVDIFPFFVSIFIYLFIIKTTFYSYLEIYWIYEVFHVELRFILNGIWFGMHYVWYCTSMEFFYINRLFSYLLYFLFLIMIEVFLNFSWFFTIESSFDLSYNSRYFYLRIHWANKGS